jgi:hypothetical protein
MAVAGVMLHAGDRQIQLPANEPSVSSAPGLDISSQSPDAPVYQVAWQSAGAPASENASAALPDKGWIGVMLEDAEGAGVRVTDVFPAGPAAFGGLRVGDILVKVGITPAANAAATASAIEELDPGEKVTLTIRRNGKEQELTLTPRSLRQFHAAYVREMLSRDPRHPHYSDFPGVAATDMAVELVRRLFEQNRRLEVAIRDVHREVAELRQEVERLRK